MSINSLSNPIFSNTFTVNSYKKPEIAYGNQAFLPSVSFKRAECIFGDRPKYTSQSYWSAIDIDNPQKKTQLTIENYQIKHQGLNTLDLVIEYSYHYKFAALNALSTDLIFQQINLLLLNYPNEEDFWEVMNCYLTKQILKLNPMLSEVAITIAVHPNSEFPYYRSSKVDRTNCGNRRETWHFDFPFSFIDKSDESLNAPYKVNVDYTYNTNTLEFPYPDFVVIYRQIENLLAAYDWQNESWIKTQHYLKELILQENSTLTSVLIELEQVTH